MDYIFIPTYNEAGNIKKLLAAIQSLNLPDVRILVVDDNSPDQTWKIVQGIAKRQKNVELLLRKTDRGRGPAGRDAFLYCMKHNAKRVIEMDGDFSHDPKYIPSLLAAAQHADVVLGSRKVAGGRDVERGLYRRVLTKLAHIYIRLMLGIKAKDATSGFRCYTRSALEKLDLNTLRARDHFIVTEMLYRATHAKLCIIEVPIQFQERAAGVSKLNASTVISSLVKVTALRFSKAR